MVKIKTKKQLNLPQLIEWAWDNDIRDRVFKTPKDKRGVFYEVSFSEEGTFYADDELRHDDTFTIEVEEEITENTVIPKMLVIGRFDGYEEVYNQKLSSFNQHLLSAYLIHDDGYMELIYDEVKGLVK
ncbi:hypothetical protein [Staphylococcus phage Stab22]|nr:hypothetical protein [Staphylococcus phage Stab22]